MSVSRIIGILNGVMWCPGPSTRIDLCLYVLGIKVECDDNVLYHKRLVISSYTATCEAHTVKPQCRIMYALG